MPVDLSNLQIVLGVVVALLTILSIIFGWIGKIWRWASSLWKAKPSVGGIDVPTKTVILIPMARPNALWWSLGSMGEQPLMQIVGDLNVTNISKHGVVLMVARLRKPKATGHVMIQRHNSSEYSTMDGIPAGAVSELRFSFYVQPPVCKTGKTFKADVAIIDQFNNEHWLNGLEFPYIG